MCFSMKSTSRRSKFGFLWNSSVIASFEILDPEGASAKQDVNFTVKSINDLPVFKKDSRPDRGRKAEFSSFTLDEFLSDADNDISTLKVEVT